MLCARFVLWMTCFLAGSYDTKYCLLLIEDGLHKWIVVDRPMPGVKMVKYDSFVRGGQSTRSDKNQGNADNAEDLLLMSTINFSDCLMLLRNPNEHKWHGTRYGQW